MSLPRLSFLYPSLHFSKRLFYPTVTAAAARRHRHGTAVEPTPISSEEAATLAKDETKRAQKEDVISSSPSGVERGELKSSPLEDVIGIPAARTVGSEKGTVEKPAPPPPPPPPQVPTPNLAPGEWVHHFDTYGLAKSLESSGFQNGQSVIIMKGIRGLLTKNLEVAKENLVSKSDVENESYLFHAACSELRNEIQYTRKTHIDNLRADGAAIQQEYDLLNQKFLEDMMSLKDELNGLFNDRKMVTRAEQRAMENKIQELNYKITVLINSDLRSEIEKLRWTTTRRGLIAIAALAIFVVSSIRMSKSGHEEKKDKKSKEKNEEKDTHDFENRLLPSDALAESLANSGPRASGANYVSLG